MQDSESICPYTLFSGEAANPNPIGRTACVPHPVSFNYWVAWVEVASKWRSRYLQWARMYSE